jgi:hypothetical protein
MATMIRLWHLERLSYVPHWTLWQYSSIAAIAEGLMALLQLLLNPSGHLLNTA